MEEGVSIGREIGGWSAAEVLGELGVIMHAQGDHSGAQVALIEALDAEREFGNRPGIGKMLLALGVLSHDMGDVTTAKARLKEALTIMGTGNANIMLDVLEAFAGLSLELARPIEGARLWGCAQRHRQELGILPDFHQRLRCERHVAAAREVLRDDAAFDLAWNEGRSWSSDDALRHVLNA